MLSTPHLDVPDSCSTLIVAESLLVSGWGVCPDETVSELMAEMLSTGPELRLLRLLSCVTLVLLFQVNDAKRDLKGACSTCRQITDNFNKVREL